MQQTRFHLHLISDSTGETVAQLARVGLARFSNVEATEHVATMVREPQQLDLALKAIEEHGGDVVFFSIADSALRARLEKTCRDAGVPAVSVLDHVIHTLSRALGQPDSGITGGQHRMDEAYFARIEALDFAIAHDDGQGLDSVGEADILLVGVSRSSKTPTSIYLAHRGYRVANYPLVPGVEMPLDAVAGAKDLFIVGLIKDARSLAQIRRNRLEALGATATAGAGAGDAPDAAGHDYADRDKIAGELAAARKLFTARNWPVIDVTRRSVEETAASIINLYNEAKGKA